MDKIKRIILFNIPMSICNFRCSYCYLSHREECYQNKQPDFKYSPEHVAKALSRERLGGKAYINFCAEGETLLTKNIDKYIYELVKEGHYIEIVTNATVTPIIDKILSWDKQLLKRIEFKCSFHYLQLLNKNLLDIYSENIKKIWAAGSSANIEITPCDELIPYIDEVKKYCIDNFGALPHLSIARNDRTDDIEYLTDLSIEEYDKIWSQFESDFWKFKKSIFMKKRNEFCYAGDWLLQIDLATGQTNQCYKSRYTQNVFQNINKPIKFKAIGKCLESHCYNGHALLTLGCIPDFTEVKYGEIRNRIKNDGTEWLQPELKQFFNSRLWENNLQYNNVKKFIINSNNICRTRLKYVAKKLINKKNIY